MILTEQRGGVNKRICNLFAILNIGWLLDIQVPASPKRVSENENMLEDWYLELTLDLNMHAHAASSMTVHFLYSNHCIAMYHELYQWPMQWRQILAMNHKKLFLLRVFFSIIKSVKSYLLPLSSCTSIRNVECVTSPPDTILWSTLCKTFCKTHVCWDGHVSLWNVTDTSRGDILQCQSSTLCR